MYIDHTAEECRRGRLGWLLTEQAADVAADAYEGHGMRAALVALHQHLSADDPVQPRTPLPDDHSDVVRLVEGSAHGGDVRVSMRRIDTGRMGSPLPTPLADAISLVDLAPTWHFTDGRQHLVLSDRYEQPTHRLCLHRGRCQ